MNEWIGQVLPFWKDLTETEKQMLLTHTALEEYEKGVLLHIDGGDCAGVQIVKEGQVRVYITSPSGGEITLYRLVEGDVSVLYDKGNGYFAGYDDGIGHGTVYDSERNLQETE